MKKNRKIITAGVLAFSLGLTACVPSAYIKFNSSSDRVELTKGYLWFDYCGGPFSEAEGERVTAEDAQFNYTYDISVYTEEEMDEFAQAHPLTTWEHTNDSEEKSIYYCFIDEEIYAFIPCEPGEAECMEDNTEGTEAMEAGGYYMLAQGNIYYWEDGPESTEAIKSADDPHLEEQLFGFLEMKAEINYRETTLRYKVHHFLEKIKE